MIYRFDDVAVDTQDFVVRKNGAALPIPPRGFDVLLLLIRNAGHVVEKRQIFDDVWKESFVSDNALTKVVKELRHALGDSAEDPKYIETIPKRGYRFIGALRAEPTSDTSIDASSPAAESVTTFTNARWTLIGLVLLIAITAAWYAFNKDDKTKSPSTIAVLPFKPLNVESRDESLELGMAETLIFRLSNLRDVVVRPISSVRKFTDPSVDPVKAGEELQTDAVLDGSIQRAGDRVRVTVRLVEVGSGAALWSEQFDESFTDIFRVQDSIAQRIAGVLALRLNRDEQEQLAKHMTNNPEAYELYLRGQFHWHRRDADWINQSITAYKQALEKDPNFALAYIGLADADMMLSGHRQATMMEAREKAAANIRRALEIDSRLAQAHNALAELKYQYEYDWRGAEEEFKTALDLNPNVAWIHQAYGWYLMSDARFDAANVEMERARQLDPSSLTVNAALGRLYYFSRQYDRAIQQYQNLIAQEPDDVSLHIALLTVYVQNKMYPHALEERLRIQELRGVPKERLDLVRAAFNEGGWEAVLRKNLRELDEESAERREQFAWSYANVYVGLGDKEKAFYWFEKLFDKHDVSIIQFKIEPAYDLLRDDPRYAELLSRIGQQP